MLVFSFLEEKWFDLVNWLCLNRQMLSLTTGLPSLQGDQVHAEKWPWHHQGKITLAAINHVAIINLFSKWDLQNAVSLCCLKRSARVILPVLYFLFLSLKRDCSPQLLSFIVQKHQLWLIFCLRQYIIFSLWATMNCVLSCTFLSQQIGFTYIVFREGHIFHCLLAKHIIALGYGAWHLK